MAIYQNFPTGVLNTGEIVFSNNGVWTTDRITAGSITSGEIVINPSTPRRKARSRAERLEETRRAMRGMALEIERLENLPKEPQKGTVIKFTKKFNPRSKAYDYAAIRAGDGLWYTTGTVTVGYEWEEFLDWLGDDVSTITKMRKA